MVSAATATASKGASNKGREAGADLDVSGVWTFIDNSASQASLSNAGINQSRISGTPGRLSRHGGPEQAAGPSSMLAMLQV